jgi:hypothetical protein
MMPRVGVRFERGVAGGAMRDDIAAERPRAGLHSDLPPQTAGTAEPDPSAMTTADQRRRQPCRRRRRRWRWPPGLPLQGFVDLVEIETRRVERPTDPLHALVVLGMGGVDHHLQEPVIAPRAAHILRRARAPTRYASRIAHSG